MAASVENGLGTDVLEVVKKERDEAWSTVIGAFFASNGLVRQQIDSFDEFAVTTLQHIVSETPPLILYKVDDTVADRPSGEAIPAQAVGAAADQESVLNCRRPHYAVTFGQVHLMQPTVDDGSRLMPQEARLRGLTYSGALYVDVTVDTYSGGALPEEGEQEGEKEEGKAVAATEFATAVAADVQKQSSSKTHAICLGRIPIMVKSRHCYLHGLDDAELRACGEDPHDPGSYFIASGQEKVIVAQERMAHNVVYVREKGKTNSASKFLFAAEIRSSIDQRPPATLYVGQKRSTGEVEVTIAPYVRAGAEIPLFVLLRALGVCGGGGTTGRDGDSDDDLTLLMHVLCHRRLNPASAGGSSDDGAVEDQKNDENDPIYQLLQPSFQNLVVARTADEALDYIGKRGARTGASREARIEYARRILRQEMLPHIGQGEESLPKKALFVGYMTYCMLATVCGQRRLDDRDHFGHKRLDLAGPLLAQLFRQLFRRVTDDLRKVAQRRLDDGRDINFCDDINPNTITNGLRYSLATGNWCVHGRAAAGGGGGGASQAHVKLGVAQPLNRLTYLATISHVRRTNMPIGRDGKMFKPRQLHNAHLGRVCLAETPEGATCGLVKNLAIATYVTPQQSDDLFRILLIRDLAVKPLPTTASSSSTTSSTSTSSYTVAALRALQNKAKVLVNGDWIGVHSNGARLAKQVQRLRRSGRIDDPTATVYFLAEENELRIFTDQGRCVRPLLVVDEKDSKRLVLSDAHVEALRQGDIVWADLLSCGAVEYVDMHEEETCLVAITPDQIGQSRSGGSTANFANFDNAAEAVQHTHCEIHPSMIFGACASVIPFPNHNQAPRNTYQSAMGKQAVGTYAENYRQRMDQNAHVLHYTQRPLVTTRAMEHLGFTEMPAGTNAIVAIMCYTGYNQEDSVIVNQSALDRGLFRSTFFRTYTAREKRDRPSSAPPPATAGAPRPPIPLLERFEKPDPRTTAGMGRRNYDKLDADGLPRLNERLTDNDVVIGKVTMLPVQHQQQQAQQTQKEGSGAAQASNGSGSGSGGGSTSSGGSTLVSKDSSLMMRQGEWGIVDQVIVAQDEVAGARIAKVRTRHERVPEIGDKLSSTHGQKGTIGMTYCQEDMPFTCEGISPDVILNPHAVPSRMTIGQLCECLLGKVAAGTGYEGDGTPFSGLSVERIAEVLHKTGYQRHGYERLYCGRTGQMLESLIFIGPTFYQRLKHMVQDKVHARARGPKTLMTRQPTEGRGRDGGLRFGEMERDCLVTAGASAFLKDRLMDQSDAYEAYACQVCGLMAGVAGRNSVYHCRRCRDAGKVVRVQLPYAFKLLSQEMLAMSVSMRFVMRGANGQEDDGVTV